MRDGLVIMRLIDHEPRRQCCIIRKTVSTAVKGHEKKSKNSQSPHPLSMACRSADIFLGSDASFGLHQQICTTRVLAALHQEEGDGVKNKKIMLNER